MKKNTLIIITLVYYKWKVSSVFLLAWGLFVSVKLLSNLARQCILKILNFLIKICVASFFLGFSNSSILIFQKLSHKCNLIKIRQRKKLLLTLNLENISKCFLLQYMNPWYSKKEMCGVSRVSLVVCNQRDSIKWLIRHTMKRRISLTFIKRVSLYRENHRTLGWYTKCN